MADDDRKLKIINSLISVVSSFLIELINIIITVLLFVGALTSIVLLYKLFPDTAIALYVGIVPIFKILLYILGAVAFSLIILYIVYMYFCFEKMDASMKKKRELMNKKLIDDIVSRLKKEKIK